jgi:hypothetical protein
MRSEQSMRGNPMAETLKAGGAARGLFAFEFFTPGLTSALAAAGIAVRYLKGVIGPASCSRSSKTGAPDVGVTVKRAAAAAPAQLRR